MERYVLYHTEIYHDSYMIWNVVFSNVENEGTGIGVVVSGIIVWVETLERTANSLSAKQNKGAGWRKYTEQSEHMYPRHPCCSCSSQQWALCPSSLSSGHQHLQSEARGMSYGSPGDG